jgi:hypothetical protein
MTPRQVRKFCSLKPESMSLLRAAMEDLGLSARAHDKVLRVARTIADLDGHDDIKPQNIAEAVGYRSRWGIGRWIGACGRELSLSHQTQRATRLFVRSNPGETGHLVALLQF